MSESLPTRPLTPHTRLSPLPPLSPGIPQQENQHETEITAANPNTIPSPQTITNQSKYEKRKVAGFLRQCLILMWKNSILFRRNIAGTIAEICVALLFVLILFLVRILADTAHYNDQNLFRNPPIPIIDQINATTNRSLIMYYPNNSFVFGIVQRAYTLIRLKTSQNNSIFNATSKT
jgi:hypothetical protein